MLEEDFKTTTIAIKIPMFMRKEFMEAIRFNNNYNNDDKIHKNEVIQQLIIKYIADYKKTKREYDKNKEVFKWK